MTAVLLVGKLGVEDIQKFLKLVNGKVGYVEETVTPTINKPYEI
ncbi:hypothetical protein [Ornithinibacillus caprae]|nr:hypothetical protein [Ornithinibacillus caprae]